MHSWAFHRQSSSRWQGQCLARKQMACIIWLGLAWSAFGNIPFFDHIIVTGFRKVNVCQYFLGCIIWVAAYLTFDPFIVLLWWIMKPPSWSLMSKQFLVVWPSSKLGRSQSDIMFGNLIPNKKLMMLRTWTLRCVDTVYNQETWKNIQRSSKRNCKLEMGECSRRFALWKF